MSARSGVLRSYRELVFLVRRQSTSNPKIREEYENVKQKIRANRLETDVVKINQLHKLLKGKISYIRFSMPRIPKHEDRYSQAVTYVYRDGQVVEGETLKTELAIKQAMSKEEYMTKHNRLLKRQHFGRMPRYKEFF